MNEKLLSRVNEKVSEDLEPNEAVLGAIRGDLMVSVRVSTRPGDHLSTFLKRRQLRQAFEENGFPLPSNFTLGLTQRRILILQTGTGTRPKRFVGAVSLATVTSVQLGNRMLAFRNADVTLSTGPTLPVRLVHKDDPDEFVQVLAEALASTP